MVGVGRGVLDEQLRDLNIEKLAGGNCGTESAGQRKPLPGALDVRNLPLTIACYPGISRDGRHEFQGKTDSRVQGVFFTYTKHEPVGAWWSRLFLEFFP